MDTQDKKQAYPSPKIYLKDDSYEEEEEQATKTRSYEDLSTKPLLTKTNQTRSSQPKHPPTAPLKVIGMGAKGYFGLERAIPCQKAHVE